MRTRADARRRAADAMLAAFCDDLRRRNYSDAMLAQAQLVKAFLAHLRSKRFTDLRRVRESHVEAYARHLARRKSRRSGAPLALATQLCHLTAIRRFFRFLLRRRWLLADPTKELVLPRHHNLPRTVLSLSQARQLMNAPHRWHGRWWWPHVEKRDHAILELLYGTGIRLGECVRLDVTDVDLVQAQLFVRNGKGKKDRIVPVPLRAGQALDVYLRDTRAEIVKDRRVTALFTSWMGKRLQPITLQAMVKRRAKAARLPVSISPHVLRHTCATHLIKGGAGVRHVQELLGHAHLDSAARYTRVAIKDLSAVIERSHPREKQWRRRKPGA